MKNKYRQQNSNDELQVYSKKVTTSSLGNKYIDSSHMRVMISIIVLGFLGLCTKAKISSRECPKVTLNLIKILVLNFE